MNISLGQLIGQNLDLTLKTAGTYCPEDLVVTGAVQTGSLTNAPVQDQTYTEDTTANTVLPAGGYLYINKGWHDNIKISLGHLIPEIASKDAGVEHIRYGFKAYAEDGSLITGTMADVTPSFTGGAVTATASGSVTTAPKVTINASITAAATNMFGMTTTAITGTEGTDYIKIDATGTPTNGSVTAKANASRGDVKYSAAAVGYVNVASGTIASGAMSATEHTNSVTVTPTVTDSFAARYIPVVKSQTFSGGTITAGTPSINGSNPTFTTVINASSNANTYGLTATAPSGTEGTNYIKFTPNGTGSSQTKSISIPVSRAAVTVSNSAGVIAAKDGETAVAEGSTNATASVTVTATAGTATPQYMPIVSVSGSGGGVTGSATVQVATQPKVTVSTTASDNASTYGFTNTQPSGTYVSISGNYSTESGTVSPSATATRAAVTYTNAAGAIAAHSGSQLLAATDKTLTGDSVTVKPEVTTTGLKNFYVPVATIKAVPGAPTVTAPTITRAVSVAATNSISTSGVLSTAPSSGNYLTITPSTTVTKGSSKSVASAATNSAGVVSTSTTGGTVTGTTASEINVSVTSTSSKYIKIYDGSYTIS